MGNPIDDMRKALSANGLELDDVTIARLAKVQRQGGSPEDMVRAALKAFGMPTDDAIIERLSAMAAQTGSAEEFADALLIGPCPNCGCESARNCENEPGIEDLTIGICPECKWLWCSECGTRLTRDDLECENPECFLNQLDDDDGFEEPEL